MQQLIALTEAELVALVRRAVREEMDSSHRPASGQKYVDKTQIASRFGVSRATVHNWITREGCPHLLKGKVLRFDMAAVEAWFATRPAKDPR